MSWKEEIKKQRKIPRSKWAGGSAQCKSCKNFFPRPSSSTSISGPTTDKEIIQDFKSINQSGMCEKCYQKQLNRKPQEWPLDGMGYYKRGIDRMRMGRR